MEEVAVPTFEVDPEMDEFEEEVMHVDINGNEIIVAAEDL